MTRIFTSLVVAGLMLTGCETESLMDPDPDEVLYFEVVGMGQNGSTRDTLEVVLRDESAYQEVLSTLTPLAPVPPINFEQRMVGIVAIPTQSGGYGVEVKSVERTGDQITIHYDFSIPGSDCITPQALALPFQIVSIKRSAGNVTFVRRSRTYRCSM